MYDNSHEPAVERGALPRPKLVLDFAGRRIRNRKMLSATPRLGEAAESPPL